MSAIEGTVVILGNNNPMTSAVNPVTGERDRFSLATISDEEARQYKVVPLKQSETRVELPAGYDLPDFVDHALTVTDTAGRDDRALAAVAAILGDSYRYQTVAVRNIDHLWDVHADGVKPAYVSSNDSALASALAKFFGCPIGTYTALIVNGGIDYYFAQIHGTPGAAVTYGALSANTTTPGATDTSLTGEITTAGGGLIRAGMTYAHTSGTTTATLTHTWTANGTDSLPVTIGKWASFNASSSGTMVNEDLVSPTATLSSSGDSLTLTFTLTL